MVDPLVYQALLGRLGRAVFLQQEGSASRLSGRLRHAMEQVLDAVAFAG